MSKSWWDEPSIAEVKENAEAYVQEIIEDEDDEKVVEMWNDYCDATRNDDDRLYPMWELDELYGGMKLSDFLCHIDDDFNINDAYFKEGVYGLESVRYVSDAIDYCDLANWLLRHEEDYGISALEDLYDMYNTEEDEKDEEEGGDEE